MIDDKIGIQKGLVPIAASPSLYELGSGAEVHVSKQPVEGGHALQPPVSGGGQPGCPSPFSDVSIFLMFPPTEEQD